MRDKLLAPIKGTFLNLLEWDYLKKTQVVLLYATLIELAVYITQFKLIGHPLVNTEFLLRWIWYFPTLILINGVFLLFGLKLKNSPKQQYYYAYVVGIYYSISLMVIPISIGILNIANGVIFLGTTLLSLILFPRKMVYVAVTICTLIYILSATLIVTGYMPYALALKPNILLPPNSTGVYVIASMAYTIIYAALTIYLFDISLRNWKEKEQYKDKLSVTDELTQLLNRRGFNSLVELQVRQAQIRYQEISLIIVDIDNFKKINDQYGHQCGDLVIKSVADILKKSFRSSDIVARFGGEEFTILLPSTNMHDAIHVAENCRQILESSSIEISKSELISTKASFGISSTVSRCFDYETLFTEADKALYEAKQNGKNQVRAYR